MSYGLARRIWNPRAGVDFETYSQATYGPVPVNWLAYSGPTCTLGTYSNNSPHPWMGFHCWRLQGVYGTANPILARWTANPATMPELFEDGLHFLRATVRLATFTAATSGHSLVLYVSSVPAAASAPPPIGIVTANGFAARLTTSWQLMSVSGAVWTGSLEVAIDLAVAGTTVIHTLALDDLRLYLDEITIDDHWDMEESLRADEVSRRAIGGALYRHALAPKRTWRLPLEYLPTSTWQRLEKWRQEAAPLWLTDRQGRSHPVAMVGDDPRAALHPGLYSERRGVIELESDYRLPLRDAALWEGLP